MKFGWVSTGSPLERPRVKGPRFLFMVLLITLSCASAPAATPKTDPTPTPLPRQVIEGSAARMMALKTARFNLEQEGKLGALFLGVELQLIEGQVDMPDSFELRVEATATFIRSFIEINLVGVGDQAFISDFIDKNKWIPVPAEQLPFNFADLGRTLSDVMRSVQNPVFVGTDLLDDTPSWRIKGTVLSDDLTGLASGADPGHEVRLEGWIGQADGLLRKLRIEGRIFSADSPDVVRTLNISGFDEPVTISLPSVPTE